MKFFSFLLRLLDYFFPAMCPQCREEVTEENCLCSNCLDEIYRISEMKLCKSCGSRLDTVLDVCSKCIVEEKHLWAEAFCIFDMNKTIHDMILDFKYKNKIELYPFFAKEITKRLFKENLKFDTITSVPLHPLKFLLRGYNQSALIAKKVSVLTGIPYRRLLSRKKFTKTQTSLSAEKRRKNLKNVFLAKKRAIISAKDILLIDDIFTTGSTLRSAVKELIEAGAKKVSILVLARR